jgi:uncharacterized membrane protein YphA (DoxX/SURF4 family)
MITRHRHWIILALRLIVAAFFIYAAVDKIVHPDRFADVVWDYQILPEWIVNLFAVVLPWVEVAVGFTLIAGIWLPSSAGLATAMMVMFTVAVTVSLVRGDDAFHCGCFSTTQEGAGSGWDLLWRDGLILLACLALLRLVWPPREAPSAPAPETAQ